MRICLLALCALPLLSPPAGAQSRAAAAAGVDAAWGRVAAAESERKQGTPANAWKTLQSVLESPAFGLFSDQQKVVTFMQAALAAIDLERRLDAQVLAVRASEVGAPAADAWVFRAAVSAYADDMLDVADSVTRIAQRWPEQMADLDPDLVFGALRALRKAPREAEAYFALLQALEAARWVPKDHLPLDDVWFELLQLRLARGQTDAARELVARISSPRMLIRLRIDHRFRAIVRLDDPALDVEAAVRRDIEVTRDLMRRHPDRLALTLRHIQALRTGLRLRDALAVSDSTIARIERDRRGRKAGFTDLDDQWPWLLDTRARTLVGLGQFDAALKQMLQATERGAAAGDRVSQSINLAFLYTAAERPADALTALERVDWSKGISDYGRFQLQAARAVALQMLGRPHEASAAMDWMATHRDVSPDTHTWVLLRSGDLDAAAASLIARLDDPEDRPEALAELQDYPPVFETAFDRVVSQRFEQVKARPELRAAVDRHGRIERFEVLAPSAW